ncbi:hypothetical protein FOZ63_019497, partial [Perkinsus olseni]
AVANGGVVISSSEEAPTTVDNPAAASDEKTATVAPECSHDTVGLNSGDKPIAKPETTPAVPTSTLTTLHRAETADEAAAVVTAAATPGSDRSASVDTAQVGHGDGSPQAFGEERAAAGVRADLATPLGNAGGEATHAVTEAGDVAWAQLTATTPPTISPENSVTTEVTADAAPAATVRAPEEDVHASAVGTSMTRKFPSFVVSRETHAEAPALGPSREGSATATAAP